jgi:hypothetical protein
MDFHPPQTVCWPSRDKQLSGRETRAPDYTFYGETMIFRAIRVKVKGSSHSTMEDNLIKKPIGLKF